LAIEDSTSSDCAREIRGTASIANTVMGRVASCSTSSGLSAGEIRLTSVVPSATAAISASLGALTLSTTSAAHTCSLDPRVAPASVNAASEKLAAAPAPDSTTTSYPSLRSCPTVCGVAATRVSPGRDSRGIPMIIDFGPIWLVKLRPESMQDPDDGTGQRHKCRSCR
jgi:hypothetical protein